MSTAIAAPSSGAAAAAGLVTPSAARAAAPAAGAAPRDLQPIADEEVRVPVGPEPDGTAVSLDVTIRSPQAPGVRPAVVLAHGFGGSKADLDERSKDLAARGYVVLTYSARGFGDSEGKVHLNDPAFEVADARRLVDVLAARSDVRRDSDGDPRVGIAGASYGGALALMAAATDPRVDAVVPAITWNDLADAFFPQFAVTAEPVDSPAEVARTAVPGPFKTLWASRFFGSANAQSSATGAFANGAGAPAAPATAASTAAPLCGRFDPTVCRLFLASAETGIPSPQLLELLRAHSPRPLLATASAPTLLIQGMADTLFGIEQADATARALTARGVPVAVRWIDGGHDGPSTTAAADEAAQQAWLDHYLGGEARPGAGPLPVPGFVYAGPVPRRATAAPLYAASAYVTAPATTTLDFEEAPPRSVLTPPGGEPASIVSVPGLAGASVPGLPTAAATLAGYPLAALPGQSAAFDSVPVPERVAVVGSPRVGLVVTSTASTATLYVSFWQVNADQPSLPRRLAAPVTVSTAPGVPTPVEVALPPATWNLEAGSRVRILVTSTDTMYAGPRQARADQVQLAAGTMTLPTSTATRITGEGDVDAEAVGVAAGTAAVLLAVAAGALLRRRRRQAAAGTEDTDVPLVVGGLVKTYADGHRAVDDVSWRAERGQVVGLLGPNGAGKTTTLRMVMGLIRPDAGSVYVLGEPVSAGSPVLARVGALVEGPGLLPHLTGRQNLRAYWAATGRPDEQAGYEYAMEVAALGGAVDRPVRSYSHGMRQRLGIAQAMLGLPEVLVLDEPTNGLDPPQIAAMRSILHRYAAAGRTVVISSHLLAEVELTCSHVVVMHAGRVITTGPVAQLLDSSDTTVLTFAPGTDAGAVAASLRRVTGIRQVEVSGDGVGPRLTVHADVPRPEVVRAAAATGASLDAVSSRRHLEEVFLGAIAHAEHLDTEGPPEPDGAMTDALRRVRAR